MPKYRVCKQRVEYRSAILEIEAIDEDEAEMLANEDFDELPDEEWGIDNAEESVLSVELLTPSGASSEETPKPEWYGTEDESVNTTECPVKVKPTQRVRLTVHSTGEILGTFDSIAEADDFHDHWQDQFGECSEDRSSLAPGCDFTMFNPTDESSRLEAL